MIMKLTKVLLGIALILIPYAVKADVILEQTEFNQTSNLMASATPPTTYPNIVQDLGKNLIGTASGTEFWIIKDRNTTGEGMYLRTIFLECTAPSTSCSFLDTKDINITSYPNGTAQKITHSFTSQIQLDPNKYYGIYIGTQSGTSYADDYFSVEGTTNNNYINGSCSSYTGGGGVCGQVNDIKFKLEGQNLLAYSQVWNIQPNTGSTTINTEVQVSFNYNVIAQDNISGYYLSIYDTGASGLFPVASSTLYINGSLSSGSGTARTKVNLVSGHTYRMRVVLEKTNGSTIISTEPVIFSVVTNQNQSGGYDTSNFGFFTASSTTSYSSPNCTPPTNILDVGGGVSYALCYMFVPNPRIFDRFATLGDLVMQQFPFNLINEIKFTTETLESETEASDSVTYAYNPGNGTTSLKIFDLSETTEKFPVLTTIRTIIKYALWVSLGLWATFTIVKIL